MRILHVTPRFTENSGGDGLYVFHVAHGQAEQGNDVSVIYQSEGTFTYHELGSPGNPHIAALGKASHGPLAEHYLSRKAATYLQEAIRRSNPDIIHIHGIHQYFTSAAVPVLRSAGRPIIYTVHDYKLLCGNAGFFSDRREEPCTLCLTGQLLHPVAERCKKGSLIKSAAATVQMDLWSARHFLDLITIVHSPSTYVSELLSGNQALRGRIRTVRHPLLTPRSAPRETHGQLKILFFGRLVPHKGAHIAIEALRGLRIPVHVIGDGPDMDRCRRTAGGDPDIHFHGWKTQNEIRQFMGSNTIAVFPSLFAETFCFAVAEALSEGCCVVASGRGAIPELVRDGENGSIVDPPTAAGFRDAVMTLVNDDSRRLHYCTVAPQVRQELASVEEHTVQIAGLYREAVERHRLNL